VNLWHEYRAPLVAICGIVLFLQIVLSRKSKKATASIPETTTIVPEKVAWSAEKAQGLDAAAPWKDDAKTVTASAPVRPVVKKSRTEPKKVKGSKFRRASPKSSTTVERFKIQPTVFYYTLTGSTEVHAKNVTEELRKSAECEGSMILPAELQDLSSIDLDDYFISAPKIAEGTKHFYILIVPTYNIDTALDTFLEHLSETHHDFRIDTAPLSNIAGYSVFGFGDKEGWPSENEGYCSQASEVDKWMAKLTSRKRAFPLGTGDIKTDAMQRLAEWQQGIQETMVAIATEGYLGEGVPGSGDALESDEEDLDDNDTQEKKKSRGDAGKSSLGDLEDLGFQVPSPSDDVKIPLAIDFTTVGKSAPAPAVEAKAMVPKTSPTYAALTKQGYSIIGTHSGVKICRWTKSALRGRGSCYKRSFYGIASHLCMETTPSLSCSNKCVFCWRHGTNPVGTTWRWQVDPPEMIFNGAREAHLKKIKMMRGVPGVRAERFQEAMRIRHCALSLVGEPIFYPHINEFVGMLHKDHISSFLVCNAQHPQQLAALDHVTQLYVSIDASNKDSLRKIDRPLHRDFWERFCACLDILAERRNTQRTVFRLTLVKGFNLDEEAEGYADLVARGRPCFIEVKGVTYCGTSTSSAAGLSMQNVPFWEEVQAFVLALHKALEKRGLDYGMAAEHAHSCCALLAEGRFKRDGRWCTIIDYDRFFELLESGEEFGPVDYMGEETPDWALWGKGGFDPSDERVDRKGRPKIDAAVPAAPIASNITEVEA
jgi:tRNA wybutosine-synthesizing protein 1